MCIERTVQLIKLHIVLMNVHVRKLCSCVSAGNGGRADSTAAAGKEG